MPSKRSPKGALAQLKAALATAARALEVDGLASFADEMARVLRTALALAAEPASNGDVSRAVQVLARKRQRSAG